MTGRYEVVPYRDDLREELVRLQAHHWALCWSLDADARRAYLEWKYERNPYVASPLIQVARCEGQVVGMRGMYGACWELAGRRFVAPCAGDTVIDPAHRCRGLFLQLERAAQADLAARGFSHSFNLSAGAAVQAASLALGWRDLGPLSTVERALAPGAGPAPCSAAPIEAMADLAARARPEGLRHVHDAEFFAWRLENPAARYRVLTRGGAALEGYLVLQSARDARGPARIAAWEALREEVAADLLDEAIGEAGPATGATRLEALTSGLRPARARLLRARAFAPRTPDEPRFPPALLVRALRAGGDLPRDVQGWDLSLIDSDDC